jgi:hypothetical protein
LTEAELATKADLQALEPALKADIRELVLPAA